MATNLNQSECETLIALVETSDLIENSAHHIDFNGYRYTVEHDGLAWTIRAIGECNDNN
jgi:CYTH domain-containing protein